MVKTYLKKEGEEILFKKFQEYATRFQGGDATKNRLILLKNILENIKNGKIRSADKELEGKKIEIANLKIILSKIFCLSGIV